MKKSCIFLTCSLASLSTAGAVAYHKFKTSPSFRKKVEIAADKGANAAAKGVAAALPDMNWQNADEFTSEGFMTGHETLLTEPADGAKWNVGFAKCSITPLDYETDEYYLGGYLHMPPNRVSGIVDDERIRAVCLDDGSGRGAVVFAVIDTAAVVGTDVRKIRRRLDAFAKKNNIVSINISATHTHSAIDTFGLWGDLKKTIKNNIKAAYRHEYKKIHSGKNPHFMERLYDAAADTVIRAVNDRRPGRLFIGETNELKYSKDKRPPYVVTEDLSLLRFAPDDGTAQTMAVLLAAHAVALGESNTEISGDFIYYMDEKISAAGNNFLFIQGAELAVTTDRGGVIPDNYSESGYSGYGSALGDYILAMPREKETEIEPLLNIIHLEKLVPPTNGIIRLLMGTGVIDNLVIKTGSRKLSTRCVTEYGLAQLGRNLCLALIPGELAPEIVVGGAFGKDESYNGTEWIYPPMCDLLPEGVSLKIVGLCNDLIGYILPDNDYGSIFAKGHYEEFASVGRETGAITVEAFKELAQSLFTDKTR